MDRIDDYRSNLAMLMERNTMKYLIIYAIFLGLLLSAQTTYAECIKGDCQNGQGTSIYYDGGKYVGHWKNNRKNGQGILTYSDGTKYIGQWKDDKKNGQGVYFYLDGRRYEGQWKDGLPNGQGVLTTT